MPLLTSLCQWLLAQKEQVLPKSPIAAAINYVLNQWEALSRYTTDGDLHIDNNISERTLKLIGIGRDNWLFVGSDQAARPRRCCSASRRPASTWASTPSPTCATCWRACRPSRPSAWRNCCRTVGTPPASIRRHLPDHRPPPPPKPGVWLTGREDDYRVQKSRVMLIGRRVPQRFPTVPLPEH